MPRTLELGLTPEQIAQRRHSIGGSDANIIMGDDPAAIDKLWAIKTGRTEPDDLSGVLMVQMGQWTEELNRYWYEKQTDREVAYEGQFLTSKTHGWMHCNLDGMTTTEAGDGAVFEAKHMMPFHFSLEKALAKYTPQLHHNMYVLNVEHAVLSIFTGNDRWIMTELTADPFYTSALIEREKAFWDAVISSTPPRDLGPQVAADVKIEARREVDMTGNNAWASWAEQWIETHHANKLHGDASREIKDLMEKDVGRAFGHGIEVTRNKRGAMRIKRAVT